MPQFAVLIYEKELPNGIADMPPEVLEAHGAVDGKIEDIGGKTVAGFATLPAAEGRAVRGDEVTVGAFHDTREKLSGFFVVEATDLDHAVQMAKFVPIMDGGVEVRPLLGE